MGLIVERNLYRLLIVLTSVSTLASCGYFKVNSASTKTNSSDTNTNPDTNPDPDILSDKKPAKINSVSSPTVNGVYKTGDAIDISIEFSKPVVVSGGTPFITLNAGLDARATYLSGSGSNILVFRYVIKANENIVKLNYSSTRALDLNAAIIRDVDNSGEDVKLDLPPIGSGSDLSSIKNISVDTTLPDMPTNLDDSTWSNVSVRSPTLTFTPGADNLSGNIVYKAKIVDNTDSVDVTSFASVTSGTAITGLNLVNGHNYAFIVKAVDLAGNESIPIASNGWTVDTVRPTQPGFITVGATPANVNRSTPAFTFTNSTDSLSGIAYYEIEIRKSSDSSIVKPYSRVAGDGVGLTYSETVDFLTSGESYFVNIRAVDVAGNLGIVRASTLSWVALQCPTNFVAVPPRMPYSSLGFCVAKYEMKIQGNNVGDTVYNATFIPESRPAGTPWVNLNRAQAINECQSLGAGYSVISNAQWQTIAQNAEMNQNNWTSGVVGSELMFEGHSDNVPAAGLAIDNISFKYNLTGNNNTQPADAGKNQRRTLLLSTGAELWDFTGNVVEWIKDDINTNFATDNFWSIITDATTPVVGTVGGLTGTAKFLFGPMGSYPTLQVVNFNYGGFGRGTLNLDPAAGSNAAVRGGRWIGDNSVGVFRISQVSPTFSTNYTGFRCVYSP